MFIGHYMPAFVAAVSPKAPRLGPLFVAAQLIDIAFFAFVLLGIEHLRLTPQATVMNAMDLYDMPWTHSLTGAIGWGLGFSLIIKAFGSGWRAAAIGGAVVVSHWFVDLLVHVPDLTLAGGPPKFGLSLWDHPWIEIPLELMFAFGGLTLYLSRTHASGAMGRWSPLALALGMAALQAINWAEKQPLVTSPAPPATGWLGLFAYAVLAALAWWVGRTREVR